jgi:dolichol-phosphate mannosyltransferase
MPKISVIIPVYNEALAISELLHRVFKAPLPDGVSREVVIVDDGSTDVTVGLIQEYITEHPEHSQQLKLHTSIVNHGKGAALRAGFKLATGEILLVQDGDLEYSPYDYSKLVQPFLENAEINIVYGSRFTNGHPKGMRFRNLIANLILALTTNILYGQKLTDEATGYKVFRNSVLNSFQLSCRGFEFCPEFTGKALRAGYRIHEIPISYNPRGILEGKKIKAKDVFIAMWWLFKTRFKKAKKISANKMKSEFSLKTG